MSEKIEMPGSKSVRARCERGFIMALDQASPGIAPNEKGYVLNPQHNLLSGIDLSEFREAFESGAGQELGVVRDGIALPGKFCAAYSSSALAVNHFAPLAVRRMPELGRHRSLHSVKFEVPFPTGLRGTPPHLDALLGSDKARVAIESKCLEYVVEKSIRSLEKTAARLNDKYLPGITDHRCHTPWFDELRNLAEDPARYRYLDAAQLIKHALGLMNAPDDRPTVLLYTFWEPLDANHSPLFAAHRGEIASFASRVTGSDVKFEAMSYPDVWAQWRQCSDPFLDAHVIALRQRYAFAAFAL